MNAPEDGAEDPGGSGEREARDDGAGSAEPGAKTPVTQQIGRIVVGALAALFVVFAVFNRQDVVVDWIFTTTETPLIVVLVGTFVLGVLVGVALLWRSQRVRARPDRRPQDER